VSLSACTSTNGTSATSTTNTTSMQPKSLVPFPDGPGNGVQPTATPDLPNRN
jgi:hypothetical protein